MNNNPLGQFASSSFSPIFNTRSSGRRQRGMPGAGGGMGGGGGYSDEFSNESELAGMAVSRNPFLVGLGNSMGTMEGLGSTIGNAFGTVNQANLESANQQRKLNTLGALLSKFFGGNTGGGNTGGSFSDTMSRQAVRY